MPNISRLRGLGFFLMADYYNDTAPTALTPTGATETVAPPGCNGGRSGASADHRHSFPCERRSPANNFLHAQRAPHSSTTSTPSLSPCAGILPRLRRGSLDHHTGEPRH